MNDRGPAEEMGSVERDESVNGLQGGSVEPRHGSLFSAHGLVDADLFVQKQKPVPLISSHFAVLEKDLLLLKH